MHRFDVDSTETVTRSWQNYSAEMRNCLPVYPGP